MPSCTVPMFSKIDVTSQLTQPAAVTVCHASGNAVATAPASIAPWPQSVRPIAAVPTSNKAFRNVSEK
ncbi:hypothetical protein D3C84_1258360 [compost metagenome]